MNRTPFFLLAAACLTLAGCGSGVKETAHGVVVTAGDGTKVKVEVVTDDIFHVAAIPQGAKFSEKESLIVVPQEYGTAFQVNETDAAVQVTTAKISAIIDKATGAVKYVDSEGKEITSENARSFSPIEVEGTKAYTVHQTFNSPDDEAFYGLGQHQADEWNYKGKNEELYQYNTKISVPFVVSSKTYGILWDSYSFLRWGDPREYAHLNEVFKLYDKDGVEGALTGTYVPSERPRLRPGAPKPETLIRREPAINQEFLETPDCNVVRNAPEFSFGGSNVTFEGEIEAPETGTYRFLLYYAGYTKVYVNDELVVPEIWRTAWNPNSRKFALNLEAGKKTALRIEWKPDGGTSYCGLRVLSPVEEKQQNMMSWWGEMQDQIDYYFINSDSIDGVISGYRTLTGKAQIMPKWAMGYWQSRERYTTQAELVATLKEFRDRHVPVDNIVQDWQYWERDQWGSQEFDLSRFPDAKGMVDSVHAMGGRFMISVWPKFYTNTEHFKEFDEQGWMYKVPVTDSVEDWLNHYQSFYDAYAEGARKLFWQQMYEHLYPIGVDAWWMDASEPNIHDCTDMDYRKAMQGPTALGPSTQYFNAYALMNAEAIYNGQRGVNNMQRVFLLTRNGFAGLQRYSTASWSGDIGTRWEDMKAQLSAGLNYSICGIPFWGQDIGGFCVESRYSAAQRIFERTGEENEDMKEWRELQSRWHQWGVYCPLYRAHGQFPYREPWNLAPEGHPAYESILTADRLRYTLMPYIYTLDSRVWFEDYTMMRALVMDYLDDVKTHNISDEFMMGDALLICPVFEYGQRSREVYLPKGNGWYDVNDGYKYYEGGTTMVAPAPYEFIPVYAREGQIIPEGPAIEYTGQENDGSLNLKVFSGMDASFTLYEDDGLTYAYENGEYANIPMSWDEASKTLTIGDRKGEFKGMKTTRPVTVELISKDAKPKRSTVTYNGSAVSVKF